ncbi:MAG: hypothetical protein JWO44_2564 [Bacteroidetes bacterium]|nr:hypothetical protein [Bacteroidota bacterium]
MGIFTHDLAGFYGWCGLFYWDTFGDRKQDKNFISNFLKAAFHNLLTT